MQTLNTPINYDALAIIAGDVIASKKICKGDIDQALRVVTDTDDTSAFSESQIRDAVNQIEGVKL